MRAQLIGAGILLGLAGCYVQPAPAPSPRVVERETVDPYGNVVSRETIVEDGPPPPGRVEVIPVAPYPTAVWVRGYWIRSGGDNHRWIWVRGYWR